MGLSLEKISPTYAAILAQIYTLQARQVELSEVTANPFLKVHHPSIERPSRDPVLINKHRRELPPPAPNDSVTLLLGDQAPPSPAARFEDDDEVVQRLCNELAVIRRAMETLQQKLRQVRLTASAKLCETIKTEFNRLAKAVATDFAKAAESLRDYNTLVAGLRANDVAFAQLGALDQADVLAREWGPVNRLLKSASDAGHISARASRKAA
jgi:hypothetical protein